MTKETQRLLIIANEIQREYSLSLTADDLRKAATLIEQQSTDLSAVKSENHLLHSQNEKLVGQIAVQAKEIEDWKRLSRQQQTIANLDIETFKQENNELKSNLGFNSKTPMTTPTPEPIAHPSLEQMRVEVCEWLGWKLELHHSDHGHGWEHYSWATSDPSGRFLGVFSAQGLDRVLPALTLDWLHECVQKLRKDFPDLTSKYYSNLSQITLHLSPNIMLDRVEATAPQRLLVLWRTIKGL